MAINFSASFAACIAAGLKVPRQIMYCITQDTGQPYVLYKDSQEAERNAAAIGGTAAQWGTDMYPGIQQQHLNAQQQQQQNAQNTAPQIAAAAQAAAAAVAQQQGQPHSPSGDHRENGGDAGGGRGGQGQQGQQGSPSTSPYPPQGQQQQQQQQQRTNGNGGPDDDVNMSQVAAMQAAAQQQNHNNRHHHRQQQQQQHPTGSAGDTSGAGNPHNVQQQQQNGGGPPGDPTNGFQAPSGELGGYYAPRHPAPQGSMLAPPGFPPLHYLNKPVLPGMAGGAMDQNGTAGAGGAGGLDSYAMPELLPGQQNGGGAGGSGAGNAANQQNGHATNGPTGAAGGGGGAGTGGTGSGAGGGGGSGTGRHPTTSPATNHKPPKPHSDLRLFKCLTCGKDFKQKSTLLQHDRIHTDARPYPCTECGKRFRQQSHLTQHLRIHANEKPFTCGYCSRSFRQRAILNQHIRIHSDVSPHLIFKNGPHPTLWPQDVPYPGDETDSKNDIAGAGYHDDDSQGAPDGSGGIHYPSYFKDGKGQKILPDVLQHIGVRPANMPLYVRCPICDKEFKQKTTLLQHGCIHIESRPYPCPECGKRFRQQSHLTQHLRIHTNEKPFGCLYCPRFFRQRTILNQHIRIHTGEKPYKCGQCGKDFRQKAILDQHTRTHQVGASSSSKGDRPFCCPMPNCRRRFATENEVTKHIDNHMNPNSTKARRQPNVGAGGAGTQGQAGGGGGGGADNKANILPRVMAGAGNPGGQQSVVKNELYFPQCYGPPFQQAFQPQGQPTAAHANGGPQSQPPVTVAPGVVVQQQQQNAPASVVAQ